MMRLATGATATHMLRSSEKFQIICCSQLHLCLFSHCTKVTNSDVIQAHPKSVISMSNKERRRYCAKHFQVYFKQAFAISQHLLVGPQLPQDTYFFFGFSLFLFINSEEIKKKPAASQHPWSLGSTTRICAEAQIYLPEAKHTDSQSH